MLSIGQVARLAKVTVETIRFYEQEGLLPEPERKESGYRQYPAEVVLRIQFILRAKALGFSLKDIRDLLLLRSNEGSRCKEVRDKAVAKLAEIEQKIATLKKMRGTLLPLIEECVQENPVTECPILDAIECGDTDPQTSSD